MHDSSRGLSLVLLPPVPVLLSQSIFPRNLLHAPTLSKRLFLNHNESWLQKWCSDSLLRLVDQDSGEWIAKELEVRFVTSTSISRLFCEIAVILCESRARDHILCFLLTSLACAFHSPWPLTTVVQSNGVRTLPKHTATTDRNLLPSKTRSFCCMLHALYIRI